MLLWLLLLLLRRAGGWIGHAIKCHLAVPPGGDAQT
jgi:hypothetical protein